MKTLTYTILFFLLLVSCKEEDKAKKIDKIYSGIEKLAPLQEVPNFNLPYIKKEQGGILIGDPKPLSFFRGKHLLLNFWASWCAPCIKEIPDLVKLQELYKERLTVIFVNCDPESGYLDVLKILNDNKIENNVFFDSELTTFETFHITGLPETFFVNKEGLIVPIYDPETKKEQIRLLSYRDWLSADFKKSLDEVLKK